MVNEQILYEVNIENFDMAEFSTWNMHWSISELTLVPVDFTIKKPIFHVLHRRFEDEPDSNQE